MYCNIYVMLSLARVTHTLQSFAYALVELFLLILPILLPNASLILTYNEYYFLHFHSSLLFNIRLASICAYLCTRHILRHISRNAADTYRLVHSRFLAFIPFGYSNWLAFHSQGSIQARMQQYLIQTSHTFLASLREAANSLQEAKFSQPYVLAPLLILRICLFHTRRCTAQIPPHMHRIRACLSQALAYSLRILMFRPLLVTLILASRSRTLRLIRPRTRARATSLLSNPSPPPLLCRGHLNYWTALLLDAAIAPNSTISSALLDLTLLATSCPLPPALTRLFPTPRFVLSSSRSYTLCSPASLIRLLLLLSTNPAALLNPGPPTPNRRRRRAERDRSPPPGADPRRLIPDDADSSWDPLSFAALYEPGNPLRYDVTYEADNYDDTPTSPLLPLPIPATVPAPRPLSHPTPADTLLLCTWNVRSLTSKVPTVNALQSKLFPTVTGLRPIDILILTETKLCPADHRHGPLRNSLQSGGDRTSPTSSCFFSSARPTTRQRRQWARAGVCILLRPEWSASVTPRSVPDAIQGYACAIDLHHGTSGPCFLRIIGIYLPCDDPALRGAVYSYLQVEASAAAATGTPLVVGGDMNAVLHPSHRTGAPNFADQIHAAGMQTASLTSAFGPGPRPPTWTNNSQTHCGSLDDFLCSPPVAQHVCNPQLTQVATDFDHTSDHEPLLLALSLASLCALRPRPPTHTPPVHTTPVTTPTGPAPTPTPRFRRFVSADLQRFTRLCEDRLHPDISAAHSFIRTAIHSIASGALGSSIDGTALSTLLTSIHTAALQVASEICGAPPPKPPLSALPRRAAHWLPRSVALPHGRAVARASACRRAIASLRTPSPSTPPNWHNHPHIDALSTLCPHLTPFPSEDPCAYSVRIKTALSAYTREASSLLRAHHATERTTRKRTLNKLYRSDRKKCHQAVLHPDRETQPSLACIRTAAGTVLTDPAEVLPEAAAQYARCLQPKPLPTQPASIHPPWSPAACLDLDPMHLRSASSTASVLCPPTGPPKPLRTLLTRARYDAVLRARKNRKAAGPNGMPAELLKAMPLTYHDMFFDLCDLQLRSERTYLSKHSHTVLLYKKGDPTAIDNFRPIGLCDCALKLWTALLTDLLSDYASICGIFSDSQGGFRKHRRCLHQLMQLTNTVEDSNISKHPLFVLYLDFKGAFPSVDHKRLADVMSLLGLPTDAIHIVQDLYRDTTTSLVLPGGLTTPIPVRRGTIQGDCLSPLLFLLYIEPLLQWLDQGSDGYPLQCANRHTHPCDTPVERSNASAFADDIAIFSDSLRGIKRALQKVELFCDWARMDLNTSKCMLTGTEHGQRSAAKVQAAASSVKIGSVPVPFLPPHAPYKYLGVMISLTLASCHHERAICDLVRTRCESIQHSDLYDSVIPEVINSLVTSMLDYSLPTCILSVSAITKLQSLLDTNHRMPYGLHTTSSSLLLKLPCSTIVGLGHTDLTALSASGAVESADFGLNDRGKLGRQCRALATAVMERHGFDLGVVRTCPRLTSPWARRLSQIAALEPDKLHADGAEWLLATARHPPPRRILTWLRTVPNPQAPPTAGTKLLPPWLPVLWDLGIITIDSVLHDGHLLPAMAFRDRYPTATPLHAAAYASLCTFAHTHHASFWTFVGSPPRAAPPPSPPHPPPPTHPPQAATPPPPPPLDTIDTPTPDASPDTDVPLLPTHTPTTAVIRSLPGFVMPPHTPHLRPRQAAHYYTDRALFPCLDEVLARRTAPTGDVEYLLQWSCGRLPQQLLDSIPCLHALAASSAPLPTPRRTSSPKRRATAADLLVTWHPHWCVATPPVMASLRNFPALAAFETAWALPPAPLGHPLPTAYLDTSALSITLTDIRPEYDTAPLPAPAVFVRDGTAYVYSCDGCLCGCFPEPRLQQLWRRFSLHSTRQDLASLRPEPFESELVLLLRRYRTKSSHDAGGKVDLRNHWAVPDSIMAALRSVTSFDTELFASPLNVSPFTLHYCSVFARDQLFGATLDAYSRQWTGSVELNPEYEAPDMHKAIRWALASAAVSASPFLALAILPAWASHPHAAALRSHPGVHILTTVPAGAFAFRRATYTPYDTAQGTHANWPVHIALIANPAGYETYFRPSAVAALDAALTAHGDAIQAALPRAHRLPATPRHPPVRPPARPFNCVAPPRPGQTPKGFPSVAPPPFSPPLCSSPSLTAYPIVAPPPARFDPAAIYYTDASQADPKSGTGPIGVGVHCPALNVNRFFVTKDQPRTVQRGELAGIWWAILNAPPDRPLHIATDSLTSLQQLHATLYRTDSTLTHQHYAMLTAILHFALSTRTAPCIIQKVRAHVGIPGNEAADRLAKLGVTHAETAEPLIAPRTDSGPFSLWPRPQPDLPPGPVLRPNIRKSVRLIHEHRAIEAIARLAAQQPLASTPLPHQTARFWSQAAPALLSTESSAFLRHRLVPHRTLQLAVQLRHWTYSGQARLHQMRLAPSPMCLLCGQHPDTPTYAGGGCSHPTLADMSTTSHNQAVHMIVDALREGSHGGDRILVNAGVHNGAAPDRTVPSSLVPGYPGLPDIMVCLGVPHDASDSTAPSPTALYLPIEVTRTFDTNVVRAVRWKQSKYSHNPATDTAFVDQARPPFPHLLVGMRARGHRTLGWDEAQGCISETGDRILVIALGTTGSLPKVLYPLLARLGLSVSQRSTLLSALHVHALTRLRSMLDTRTYLQRSPSTASPVPFTTTFTARTRQGVG